MIKKRRRNKAFKKSVILYSLIVLGLCIIFNIYIFFTLVSYENNQTTNVLANSIKKLSDKTLMSYLEDSDKDVKLLSKFKDIIKSDKLQYVKKKDDTYEALLDGRVLFTIETKLIGQKTKLAFFSYEERSVEKITPSLGRGFIYYDVTVPSNYKIYVDGSVLNNKKASKEENFKGMDFMYYNDSMPKLVTYEINDLEKESEITVKDFLGNDVKLKKDEYKYTLDNYAISVDTYDELKKYLPDAINPSDVAHNWSLFMTKDLYGSSYGFSTISQYLIKGTSQYEMAYSWVHSIDITFTSAHTLKNPIFTDEKMNNFKIYSDSAFSCEISFTKNMVVKGKDQPDKMHDILYFIKDNGSWKLMNIQSVEV